MNSTPITHSYQHAQCFLFGYGCPSTGSEPALSKTEGNLTTGEETSYYYPVSSTGQALGDRMIAQRKGTTLSYIHQDQVSSTSVVSDNTGALVCSIKYFPFGDRWESQGTIPTDKKFTGQRLDSTGLYYYGARYYDPTIGRFISPDPIIQNYANPQFFNRYSYVLNNPLKYTDPTGLFTHQELKDLGITTENTDSLTYAMLLKATVGDTVVINGETYYFFHEAQNEWDEKGVLKMLHGSSGSFTNITDKLGNSALEAMGYHVGNYVWDIQSKTNITKALRNENPKESQFTLHPAYEMTRHDWIVIGDTIAVVGDIVSFAPPPVGIIGYVASTAGGAVSYKLTEAEYNEGKISYSDYQTAQVTFTTGLIPYVGVAPAFMQLLIDLDIITN